MSLINQQVLAKSNLARISNIREHISSKVKSIVSLCAAALLLVVGTAQSALIDDIKADMQLNEAPLKNTTIGPAWTKGGFIGMGNAPRGDATPYWWMPYNPAFKDSSYWDVITPWFVIYPGTSHTATNVRVKISGITIYALDRLTLEWKQVSTGDGKPTWALNYPFNFGGGIGKNYPRVESDGQLSYKLDSYFHPIHGGIGKYDLIANGVDPTTIAAIYVTAKTQLILDNPTGVDDRANAQILFSIGADYYPTMTTALADTAPMEYYPPVGASRYGIVKSVQRIHHFTTIDPPGQVLRDYSDFVIAGGETAFPADQFYASMPGDTSSLSDITAPTAPTTLTSIVTTTKKKRLFTTITTTKCTLSWTESTDNVAVVGYDVYRNNIKIGTVTAPGYIDDKLGAATGGLYEYAVRAFDGAGNVSPVSNIAQIIY